MEVHCNFWRANSFNTDSGFAAFLHTFNLNTIIVLLFNFNHKYIPKLKL